MCLNKLILIPIDPVHTTPFSNKNGTSLLRFQKDLRPHLSFPYRFRQSAVQRVSVMKMLLCLIYPLIFPLHPSTMTFLVAKLSHHAEVRPGLDQNRLGFDGFRPSESFYTCSAWSWQAKKPYYSARKGAELRFLFVLWGIEVLRACVTTWQKYQFEPEY